MADEEALHSQLDRVKQPFIGDFRSKRQQWDKLLDRDLPTALQPELTGSQEGLDFETADVEKALFEHVDVLMMNPTAFDVHPFEQSADAKQEARDILLWTAHTWEEMNFKRWWDGYTAEGQVRHGVSVSQLKWREHAEPDAKDEKERNDAFKRRKNCFYLEDHDIYGCYWMGDDPIYGPDIAFYEYELPYVEAKEKYTAGKTLDQLADMAWLGEGQSEQSPNRDATSARVRVIVRDARVPGEECPLPGCDHPARRITIFVCGENDELNESQKVEEYDSPFRDCSFFVVSGRKSKIRDPHRRYRPLLLPMYAEAHWTNYLNTLLATIGRTDYADEYFYIDLSNVPEHVRLPEGGVNMLLERPDPESGKIPAYPGPVMRFPKTASPHIMELLKQSQMRLGSYLPNRFLTGNANTEASNATGTAFIQQAQAAGLPYNRLLNETDGAILRIFQNIYHAINWWGQADPEGAPTRYYVTTSGQETLMRGTAKPGEIVYITAPRLQQEFDLLIRTKSDTLAEENMRWMIGKDKFFAGVYDEDDLIKAAGIEDVEGQKARLRAREVRAEFQPIVAAARKLYGVDRFSNRTGYDFTVLAQAAAAGSGAPAGTPQQSQPPNSGEPGTNVPAAVGRTAVTTSVHGGPLPT